MEPPVLVVANQHDPNFPSRDLAAVAAAVPDGTFVEIPDASHVGIDPVTLQLTMDAVLAFLSAH
jgi:pimeloyl-ACP methyl ester carboxylesterase